MKQINFFIPDQQRDRIKKLAKETGITISEHFRRALDYYFDMIDKRQRGRDEQRASGKDDGESPRGFSGNAEKS
jgi:hypothetical protein